MKKIQIILIIIVISSSISGCANTGAIKKIEYTDNISEEKILDDMSIRTDFPVRKRLIYLIAWNNIPVGRIISESGDIINYRGHEVYVMKVITESNKFLSKIYKVEDKYTSYVDTKNMTSRRYEANRKEGNYKKHLVVEYDFDKMEAEYTNLLDGSVKHCSIYKNVQDPLSAMCFFMTRSVTPGDKIKIIVNLNEKNYNLFGKVGNVEIVKLSKMGSFPAFKLQPYAELDGERVKKGKGWMYFAADKTRYPLYGVVLIPFGRVTATLVSVENF